MSNVACVWMCFQFYGALGILFYIPPFFFSFCLGPCFKVVVWERPGKSKDQSTLTPGRQSAYDARVLYRQKKGNLKSTQLKRISDFQHEAIG